jgi:hypothetical protein
MIGERLVVRSLILSVPTIIIGSASGLPWLEIAGYLMLLPFAIIGLAGFIWTAIIEVTGWKRK